MEIRGKTQNLSKKVKIFLAGTRRAPKRWRKGYGSRMREASWSAPVLWRFVNGVNRPENISPSRQRQFSSHYSDLTSPSGKAAEGRRTPRRWREGYGSRVRGASWSAPVPWRFVNGARQSGTGKFHVACQPVSVPDF
jgi:hypothetical protein